MFNLFDSGTTFWTSIIALFTLFLWRTASKQLKKLNNTSAADFMTRFKNDLHEPTNREIFELIEYKKLRIVENGVKDLKPEEVHETDFDYCIGHFEDMGLFEQRGIIDIEMVYELFGYYLEIAWENPEVYRYIIEQRDNVGEDIYDKLNTSITSQNPLEKQSRGRRI